jgi:acetyltransferase-like isoleucine patch superfamily enzyme
VLKGVTIGAKTIIGAGSVVIKDIPADCIAAGNPCKVIKANMTYHNV